MDKGKEIYLLICLLVIFIGINYPFLDSALEGWLEEHKKGNVERVIDGDTIEIGNETHRLLGMNTPERGERYYQEAKKFLEDRILNETVKIEYGKEKTGIYGRNLSYIHYNGENINKKIVEEGYGNYYFPSEKDVHYNEFVNAWKKCVEGGKRLCEPSKDRCSECIDVRDIDLERQSVLFENNCDFSCSLEEWEVKDEGRKKFIFPEFYVEENSEFELVVGRGENSRDKIYWERDSYVWTYEGDTLFLRDSEGKLVLWHRYV